MLYYTYMKWKIPPRIKVYEALGAIADERIVVEDNTAKVYSSSRGKYYTVEYNPEERAIMTNDNGSYWVGYLGYPAISFLMLKKLLPYNETYAHVLRDIAWKDINVKFKNDFSKTEKLLEDIFTQKNIDVEEVHIYTQQILDEIKKLNLNLLGQKKKPPQAY